jgi:hypothetical protein
MLDQFEEGGAGRPPRKRLPTPRPRASSCDGLPDLRVDVWRGVARVTFVQVVLRKLGRGSRAVTGRLVRAPRKGSVVVIEFSDGMHEYVTTPVKRVLRLASRDVFYIETVNSRYRLEVRDRERALEDASSG